MKRAMNTSRRNSASNSIVPGVLSERHWRARIVAIASELVTMMPPDPHVMFLPRPRLKMPTSPRVPTARPLSSVPIA